MYAISDMAVILSVMHSRCTKLCYSLLHYSFILGLERVGSRSINHSFWVNPLVEGFVIESSMAENCPKAAFR